MDEFITSKLAIELNQESELPLNRQLFNQLKHRINSLQLMPGEVLPSTRELAGALNVSRKTVTKAYEDLTNQGYIYSKTGIGTFVRNTPPSQKISPDIESEHNTIQLSMFGATVINSSNNTPVHQGEIPEMHFGATPKDLLPLKNWMKVLKSCSDSNGFELSDYDLDPFGYYPLRKAIAGYLLRQRAIDCHPDQIIVFANALSHLKLLSKMCLDEGDKVAIENPGFPFARRLFASHGAYLRPIDVDENGIIVEQLKRSGESYKFVFLTPSHQDPSGVTLSKERRLELINWVQESDGLILEDDYDCEFQLQNLRYPSLMTLERGNRIVYLGDFWKTLFPIVNIGYMVLPPSLVDPFRKAQSLSWIKENTNIPHLECLTMTRFLDEGYHENHLAGLLKIYGNRYRNFVTTMTNHFSDRITMAKESGGMQIAIQVHSDLTDSTIAKTAREAGLSLIPTQSYYFEKRVEKEFLIPFAIYEEIEMKTKIEHWARLI